MLLNTQLQLRSYLFWGIILGLIVLASLIVLPFMIAIISAYILAYMARPLFLRMKTMTNPNLSALACVGVAVLVVVIPIGLVTIGMVNQSGDFASQANIAHYLQILAAHPFLKGFNLDPIAMQSSLNDLIGGTTASLLASLPNLGVGLVITLIGMYYILTSWDVLSTELTKHIPSSNKDRIIKELGETTQVILYGTLSMAVLEFVLSLVGFTLLGVEGSLILASVIFVLAFIPSIGPMMVWLPLALFYVAGQDYPIALGVTFIGLILTIGIEIFLFGKWIGDRTPIHPFVMMIGVIGGINLFGIFGFIFGPLILASALDVVRGAMPSGQGEIVPPV